MKKFLCAVHMAGALFLTGCVSVLPEPKEPPTLYRLTVPPKALQLPSATDPIAVNIEYPAMPKALSGTDIVLSPDGRRLTVASGALWAEAAPNMLRNLLIDTLQSTPEIAGIIPKGSTRVPFRLNMNIRRFEAVFTDGESQPPTAIIQITASLTETRGRRLKSTRQFAVQQRAAARSVSQIVAAKDSAAQQLMQEITGWMKSELKLSPRA